MQITTMLSASETMALIIKTSVMVFDGYVLLSWLFCLSMLENIVRNRCLMTTSRFKWNHQALIMWHRPHCFCLTEDRLLFAAAASGAFHFKVKLSLLLLACRIAASIWEKRSAGSPELFSLQYIGCRYETVFLVLSAVTLREGTFTEAWKFHGRNHCCILSE